MQKDNKGNRRDSDQSARFREAAKKAEAGDAAAFERAFKKVVPAKKKIPARG